MDQVPEPPSSNQDQTLDQMPDLGGRSDLTGMSITLEADTEMVPDFVVDASLGGPREPPPTMVPLPPGPPRIYMDTDEEVADASTAEAHQRRERVKHAILREGVLRTNYAMCGEVDKHLRRMIRCMYCKAESRLLKTLSCGHSLCEEHANELQSKPAPRFCPVDTCHAELYGPAYPNIPLQQTARLLSPDLPGKEQVYDADGTAERKIMYLRLAYLGQVQLAQHSVRTLMLAIGPSQLAEGVFVGMDPRLPKVFWNVLHKELRNTFNLFLTNSTMILINGWWTIELHSAATQSTAINTSSIGAAPTQAPVQTPPKDRLQLEIRLGAQLGTVVISSLNHKMQAAVAPVVVGAAAPVAVTVVPRIEVVAQRPVSVSSAT